MLLKKETSQGTLVPLRVSRRAPKVSHLLFADDSLLFFKAGREQVERIQGALHTFGAATG